MHMLSLMYLASIPMACTALGAAVELSILRFKRTQFWWKCVMCRSRPAGFALACRAYGKHMISRIRRELKEGFNVLSLDSFGF